MEKLFAPAFRRFVKKQSLPLQLAIRDEVDTRKGFDKDYYAYDEVFDDIHPTFTIKETSEYMNVAEITIRRWAKEGKLPFHKVGRNYVFLVDDLRKLKRKTLRKTVNE